MEFFFNLSTELLESLSTESMALVIGGVDSNDQLVDTVNNGTGCGCTANNGAI